MAKRLTQAGVDRVRPQAARREIPDAQAPGLYLVVQPSGKKSWAYRYRLGGKAKKFTLGSTTAYSLTEAREAAKEAAKAVERGRHPLEAKRVREADTLSVMVPRWLDTDQRDNRGRDDVRRMFDKDVLPRYGDVPVSAVTADDAEAMVMTVADRGAVTQARRLHAHLHRFFKWCVLKRKVVTNPLDAVAKPGKDVARDRVLSDDELARVWHASSKLDFPFGPLYKLLVLTGARLDEVRRLTWDEVDLDAARITLEGERTKNGKRHVIPLSPEAAGVISELPRVKAPGNGPAYLFTTNGKNPVSGTSRAKQRLDRLAARTSPDGDQLDEEHPLPAWRNHDIRHTFVSHTNDAGLAEPHVIEAFVNHLSGFRKGIAGRYNHAAYLDQRVELARRWGAHVAALVGRAPGNVVELQGRA